MIIRALPRSSEERSGDNFSVALGQKCRDFRLHALKNAPGAFASSYEVESERGIEHTLQRLQNPKAAHFVALSGDAEYNEAESQSGGDGLLLSRDWLGTIVLLGPQKDGEAVVSAKSDPFQKQTAPDQTPERSASTDPTPRYHLNGMFVDPSARGSGVGMALVRSALSRIEADARAASSAGSRVTIIVDTWNTAARKLYEKAGFVAVREETYVQQPRALAEQESQAVERVAVLMERSQGVSQDSG